MGHDEHFKGDVDVDGHLWVEGSLNFGRTGVTQQTSTSTAVTINTSAGIITSFPPTASIGVGTAIATIPVNNARVKAGSTVLVTIESGTLGATVTNIPYALVSGIVANQFTITVYNIGSTATNSVAPVKVGFLVM